MQRAERHRRPPPLALLRAALLTCALLACNLLVTAHDHDAAPNPDALCAICVYGLGCGAAVDTTAALPFALAPHLRPVASAAPRAGARIRAPVTIRGPPHTA